MTPIEQAVRGAVTRLAGVATSVPDPNVRVPATPDWTVAQVFAHVWLELPRYVRLVRGEEEGHPRPEDVAAGNERGLAGLGPIDVHDLAARLPAELDRLFATVAERQAITVRFDGGIDISVDDALAILLGEALIHGLDVAQVAGRRWPLSRDDACLVLDGMLAVGPAWTNPERAAGHTATYEIRYRGGPTHTYRFTDGVLQVGRQPAPDADARMSVEPVSAMVLGYGRGSVARAVLSGKVLAWGRRPWLAASFDRLFVRP